MEIFLADMVLFIHFFIFLFISAILFLIPIGYYLNWKWIKKKSIRLLHFCLMGFVTIETIFGIVCPLTTLEQYLRNQNNNDSIYVNVIHKIMYWDFSAHYFLILYVCCLIYLVFLWYYFKPEDN